MATLKTPPHNGQREQLFFDQLNMLHGHFHCASPHMFVLWQTLPASRKLQIFVAIVTTCTLLARSVAQLTIFSEMAMKKGFERRTSLSLPITIEHENGIRLLA